MMKTYLEYILTCPLCKTIMRDPVTTSCGHYLCHECLLSNQLKCAQCYTFLTKRDYSANLKLKNDIDLLLKAKIPITKSQIDYTPESEMKNNENIYNIDTTPKRNLKRKYNEMILNYDSKTSDENFKTVRKYNSDKRELDDIFEFFLCYKSKEDFTQGKHDVHEFKHFKFKYN
jgi:hypothetical protein